MDSTFIWMLVFAGATIALLATFLIASERELKIKRRELEGLAAKLLGNEGESAPETTVHPSGADATASAELEAKNKELLAEIAILRDNVEKSRTMAEQLEAARHQLDGARLEVQTLRAESWQLEETIADLSRKLETAGEHQDTTDEGVRLRAEIADLKEALQTSEARVREVGNLKEQLVEANSRAAIFKEEQQTLSRQIAELKDDLAEAHEKLQDLELTQSRLREMEGMAQEMRAHERRLEEEISTLHDRLGLSEQNQRIIDTLQQSFDELKSKQASLTEQSLKFQEDLAAVANLFDSANGRENDGRPAPAKIHATIPDADPVR